jgi:hypothetical protein
MFLLYIYVVEEKAQRRKAWAIHPYRYCLLCTQLQVDRVDILNDVTLHSPSFGKLRMELWEMRMGYWT